MFFKLGYLCFKRENNIYVSVYGDEIHRKHVEHFQREPTENLRLSQINGHSYKRRAGPAKSNEPILTQES